MSEPIELGTSGPLLTLKVHEQLQETMRAGGAKLTCSLDLYRTTTVTLDESS